MSAANSLPPPSVIRSLYRQLLREAKQLDANHVSKVLLPIPRKLLATLSTTSQLYVPNGQQYSSVVRGAFRSTATKEKVDLGFDALNRLLTHKKSIMEVLPAVCKDHGTLSDALIKSSPRDGSYWAKLLPVVAAPPQESVLNVLGHDLMKREETKNFDVGTGLIAHPLSSAHIDRRVMLVVEKNSHVSTALVLDMQYTYPLSDGNPMFPEVFWGHDVHSGGYCHVDFTMPPTANVSILHTLSPPAESSPAYRRWMSWRKKAAASVAKKPVGEHHQLLCRPLIRWKDRTLYYSRVESLSYLATLCPGQPRDTLRIYWGCMRWPTPQLAREISDGHWIPVELSPNFFGSYPAVTGQPSSVSEDSDKQDEHKSTVEIFPTAERLQHARHMRQKSLGVDAVGPQTFPPDQPLCRREALWDQIVLALGGEFKSLVGTHNPFAPGDSTLQRFVDSAGLLSEPSTSDGNEGET